MSMIDGLRNVLGINQDPEADSYVDDNEELYWSSRNVLTMLLPLQTS